MSVADAPAGVDPSIAEPQVLFAVALELYRQGALLPADTALTRLLERVPTHIDAWHLRGVLASQLGDSARAVEMLQTACRLNGRIPTVHRHLGNALRELGRLSEALDSYTRALECRPDFKEAYVNRAMTSLALGRAAPALQDLERAVAVGADDAQVHVYRASALYMLEQYDEALESCDQALMRDPQYAFGYGVHALCWLSLERPQAALESCDRALALRADLVDVYNTRGLALAELGRVQESLASFDRAIALDPRAREPYFNKGIRLLLQGDFDSGWELYERRPLRDTDSGLRPRSAQVPHFDGQQSLTCKTLWIHAEQGLGDTLQFCRYAPLLAARGARVILAVQPVLVTLMGTLAADVDVTTTDDPPANVDYQCALVSLPRAFGTRLATIPAQVPYLRADPVRVAFWRRRLGSEGRRIGIRWQGSTGRADIGRSFPLELFACIAEIPGVRLISLQKHAGEEQLRTLASAFPVEELGSDFEPGGTDAFLDVAAVMQSLDLVITSDTSIAHLAGALARPTWLVLKHVPDWRWMLNRDDSPWYPTMRLFRQQRPGDWREVFSRVQAALASVK